MFKFRRKKTLVIEALPKLKPLYDDYVKVCNKNKKRLMKQYGSKAGKIYKDQVYLSFKHFVIDLTGVKLKDEDIANAGF